MLLTKTNMPMDVCANPTDQPESFGPCEQNVDNIKARLSTLLFTLSGFSPTTSTGTTIDIKYFKKNRRFWHG